MASQSQIQEWIQRSKQFEVSDVKALAAPFSELDAHLTLRSFIVGYSASDADVTVFKAIKRNHKATSYLKQGHLRNASRWYAYIAATHPELASAALPTRGKGATEQKESDSFDIGLLDTEKG